MFEFHGILTALGPLQVTGIVGFVLYLSAFTAVQFDWIDGNGARYSLVNIAAASLVAVSLIEDFNLASALIQGSWIVIGLVGLSRRVRRGQTQQELNGETRAQLGAAA